MKDFNYIIIGGGCAGLSLAYELEINNKLENKTLAIIEPRTNYIRDKTWSFWRIRPHNFEDCVIKSWDNFSVHFKDKTNYINIIEKNHCYSEQIKIIFHYQKQNINI